MATLIGEKVGSARAVQNEDGSRRYDLTLIFSGTKTETGADVLAATGMPAVGSAFPGDANATCRARDVRRMDKYRWEAHCEYVMDPPAEWGLGEPGQWQEWDDPFMAPPEYQVESATYEEEQYTDVTGKPIANSAGWRFETPVVVPRTIGIVRITRSQATLDYAFVMNWTDVVNADPWNGFPAHTVRCVGIRGHQVLEANWTYWRVAYEFHIRWGKSESGNNQPPFIGWREQRLDEGPFWMSSTRNPPFNGPRFTPPPDSDGNVGTENTEMKLLNGQGGLLTVPEINAGTRIYLNFDVYPAKTFAGVLPH